MNNVKQFLSYYRSSNNINNYLLDSLSHSASFSEVNKNIEDIKRYGIEADVLSDLKSWDVIDRLYDDWEEDIQEVLKISNICPPNIIGFDRNDPLCLETLNHQLLIWFSIDKTMDNLYYEMKDDLEAEIAKEEQEMEMEI